MCGAVRGGGNLVGKALLLYTPIFSSLRAAEDLPFFGALTATLYFAFVYQLFEFHYGRFRPVSKTNKEQMCATHRATPFNTSYRNLQRMEKYPYITRQSNGLHLKYPEELSRNLRSWWQQLQDL